VAFNSGTGPSEYVKLLDFLQNSVCVVGNIFNLVIDPECLLYEIPCCFFSITFLACYFSF
jgi:fumarate reductase subunit C